MYWQSNDIAYQSDDLSWASLRASSDSATPSVSESSYVGAFTYSAETLASMYWMAHDMTYQAADLDWASLRPVADTAVLVETESTYIESETNTSDVFYPTILDTRIDNSLFADAVLSIIVSGYNIADFYATDVLQPVITGVGTPIELIDTVLKFRSSTAWESTAVIKVKQSDETWQEVPIYTKQLDQSWM